MGVAPLGDSLNLYPTREAFWQLRHYGHGSSWGVFKFVPHEGEPFNNSATTGVDPLGESLLNLL